MNEQCLVKRVCFCLVDWLDRYRFCCGVIAILSLLCLLLISDKLILWADVSKLTFNGFVGLTYSVFPWACLFMMPFFIMGGISHWLYRILISSLVLIQVAEWFARIHFDIVLDGDWVGMLMGSSLQELTWFLCHYVSFITIISLIGVFLFIYLSNKMIGLFRSVKASRHTVVYALFSLIICAYGVPLKSDGVPMFATQNLIRDTYRNFKAYLALSKMKNEPALPNTIRSDLHQVVTGVFVLGESATRSHFGLYGYDRETTPQMMSIRDELIVFRDLVTPVPGTAEAMRYVFTTRTVEQDMDLRYTMAQVLRRAGYDVALYSNQLRWGSVDGDESFDFAGCEPLMFINENEQTNTYDSILWKYLDQGLAHSSTNSVIFLHMNGSHFPAASKYPHEIAPFVPETVTRFSAQDPAMNLNHYDNSIWYTDFVLGGVVKRLKALNRPAWMIYISDHGETPSSKSWRMKGDRDLWDVPFFVWISEEFKRVYPEKVQMLQNAKDKALQSDQLMYGLLTFAGVNGLGELSESNFLSKDFKVRKPRINKSAEIVNGMMSYRWEKIDTSLPPALRTGM